MRLGTAWGFMGLFADGSSTGAANDLVLGATSGKVRIGPDSGGQNLYVNGDIAIMGKHAFRGNDSYLRINQDNAFTSGTHFLYRANFYSGLTTGNWWDVEPGAGNLLVQGRVGIGTATPAVSLDVADGGKLNEVAIGSAPFGSLPYPYESIQLPTWANLRVNFGSTQTAIFTNVGDMQISGRLGTAGWFPTPRTRGWGGGIHTWDVEAEGTMWSSHGYQSGPRDLAENYPSDMDLEPGDVVCLDQDEDRIIISEKQNDCLVLGVVSTAPGFLLNSTREAESKKVFPVALCGRVPCKVVDENGPIKRGDLLTSSSTTGHAMKASPIEIKGEELFRPGTIIGKALGPLESGKGVIDIFVFSS